MFGQILPATALFNASSRNCVGQLSWGLAPRPEALPLADRHAAFGRLRRFAEQACGLDTLTPGSPQARAQRSPRVVAFQRAPPDPDFAQEMVDGQTDKTPRWLNRRVYEQLSHAFAESGIVMQPCCDYDNMSVCEMLSITRQADIILGLHGAGLANAMFASRGVVLVEIKNDWNWGTHIYHQIAQGQYGGYIHVEAETGDWRQGNILSPAIMGSLVQCIVALWRGAPLSQLAGQCANASYHNYRGNVFGVLGISLRNHTPISCFGLKSGGARIPCFEDMDRCYFRAERTPSRTDLNAFDCYQHNLVKHALYPET